MELEKEENINPKVERGYVNEIGARETGKDQRN